MIYPCRDTLWPFAEDVLKLPFRRRKSMCFITSKSPHHAV